MKRLIKTIIAILSLSLVALITVCARAGQAISEKIDVSLLQQENAANNKIRYVATIENVDNLNEIVDIDIHFTLSKSGQTTRTATKKTTKVYTSIAGTNGFAAKENTYYAVYTVTQTNTYPGYTLGAYFTFNYSDSTSENTNSISYTIPQKYTVDTYGSGSFEQSSSINDALLADSIENGNIFHAWNWSMSVIQENLQNIKNAGYTAVQTSPMQPQKDYYEGNTAKDGWWKLYQPLGFCIAPDTCQNAIGTKSDLQSMVTAAHNIGLKVIVDVVANHLAGSYNQLDSSVAAYESEIYGSDGTLSGGALLHSETVNSAQDGNYTTNGNIGLPDLNTHHSTVQNRVLSLLKEYIDLGVDGFRFDAAKHIETDNSSEPYGASQFWPTVVNGARSYATAKGQEIYCYGEILNTVGNNRSYDWYLPYMDVIANKCGNELRVNFNNGTAAASSAYNPTSYSSGENCIVWAESHDTYANDEHESPDTSIYNINKTYAIMGSRNGAKALYLARPTDSTGTSAWTSCTTKLGAKGSDAYKLTEVAAVNKFRNYWGTNNEWLANDSNFAMVVRYNSSESGMVIVNAGTGTSVSNVTVPSVMKDGTYEDIVSGNTFTVSGGKVSGTMASSCIAVLVSSTGGTGGETSITSTASNTFYTNTMTATYTIKNAESATMTIDGDTFAITSGATITFGATMAVGDTKTVSITAGSTTKSFTYTKVEAPQTYKVYFEKPSGWTNLYAHLWGGTATATTWPGNQITATDGKYYFEFEEGAYQYVVFNDGTNKTEDIALSNENATYSLDDNTSVVYFTNNLNWSTVNAYMWLSETVHNADWPGVTLTLDSTSGYYKANIGSYTKAIFNNGSSQTVDITLDTTAGAAVYKLSTEKDSSDNYYVEVALKVKAGATCEHTYSAPVWTWNEYASATAKFTCSECGTQKTVNATITSEVTLEPTETTTGTRTYTATVTFNGNTYTNTKNETLPMNDGTITTVARVEATCETAGNILYYIKNAKYYSDSNCTVEITLQDTVIPAKGHTIAAGVYSVASGVTCSVCGETVTPSVSTETVYYLVPSDWGDDWNTRVNIYYWNDGSDGPKSWPGVQMTKGGTVTYAGTTYTVYSYTFSDDSLSNYGKVIFNSGSSGTAQTLNLTVHTGNCYLNNYDTANYEDTGFIYIPEGN